MSKIRGKQIMDDSIDLGKIKSGSKVLPAEATLGSAKTVQNIEDAEGTILVTKEYVAAKIDAVQSGVDAIVGDNTTIELTDGVISVKDGGISIAKLESAVAWMDYVDGNPVGNNVVIRDEFGDTEVGGLYATLVKSNEVEITSEITKNTHVTTKYYVDTNIDKIKTAKRYEEFTNYTTVTTSNPSVVKYDTHYSINGDIYEQSPINETANDNGSVYVNGVRCDKNSYFFAPSAWDGNTRNIVPTANDFLYFDTTKLGFEIEAIDVVTIEYTFLLNPTAGAIGGGFGSL